MKIQIKTQKSHDKVKRSYKESKIKKKKPTEKFTEFCDKAITLR